MAHDVSVSVGADNSGLKTGLTQARGSVDSFATSAASSLKGMVNPATIAAVAVAAIGKAFASSVGEAGKLTDMAGRLEGVSSPSLQAVANVAELYGANLEDVVKSMNKVTVNAIAGVKGNEEMADSFNTLGTSAETFANLSLEDRIRVLAKAYDEAGNDGAKLDALLRILGKSGAALIPLLKAGSQSLNEELGKAGKSAQVNIAALDDVGDAWTRLKGKVKANAIDFFGRLARTPEVLKFAVTGKSQDAPAPAAAAPAIDVEALAEDKAKTAEDEKKAEEDLAKLRAENDKKEEAARQRSLTLAQKKLELEVELAAVKASTEHFDKTDADREDTRRRKLDAQAALKEVNESIAKEAAEKKKKDEESEKRNSESIRKLAREQIRNAIDVEKELLKASEEKESTLENAKRGFSVDSVAAIGGGLKGANYSGSSGKLDDKDQKQLALLREQIALSKKQITLLEEANKDSTLSFDTAFN